MAVCKRYRTHPTATYPTSCWPRNNSARTNNAKGFPANRRSEIQSHNTVTNHRCGFIISPSTRFTPSGTTYILIPDSNHYCLRTWNSWNPMLFLTFPYTQLYALCYSTNTTIEPSTATWNLSPIIPEPSQRTRFLRSDDLQRDVTFTAYWLKHTD